MATSNHHKAAAIILLLLFSAMVTATYFFEQLFPIVPVTLLLSVATILAIYYDRDEVAIPLALVCIAVTAHLVWMAQFGATMHGNDTDRIALWVQAVIESGSRDSINRYSSFYASAPAMPLLTAIASIMLETTGRWGFLIYPVLTGTLVPVTVAASASRIWGNPNTTLIAAILSATAAQGIGFATGPIPQSLAVFLSVSILLVLVILISDTSKKFAGLIALVVLFSASMHTHKISVFMIFLMVGMPLFAYVALPRLSFADASFQSLRATFATLTALVAVLLIVQTDHMTGYLARGIGRMLTIGQATSGGIVTTEYTHAVPLNGDLLSIASYATHLIVGLGVGAICGLVLTIREYRNERVVLALAACLGFATMAAVSVFAPVSNGRILYYAEPLIALVIAGGVVSMVGPRRSLAVVAIIALVTTQLFVAPATPDYHDTTRTYLTTSEVDAKQWGEMYSTGTVHTDQKYERENPPANIKQLQYPDVYRSLGDETLQGEISDDYVCIALRDENIHAVPKGTYRWTWDLEEAVQSEFDRVHSTAGVRHYCR